MICDYGCDQEANYQFKNGKWCCSRYFSSCLEVKRRNTISNINRGKETINKMKLAWKRRKENVDYERQQKLRGRKQSRIMKRLWKDGIYDTEEYRKKLSIGVRKVWKDPESVFNSQEWRDGQSKRSKDLYNDPEFLKKYQDGNRSTPNRCEKLIRDIILKLNLKYNFVGDHSLWIDGRNPDFINEDKRKIIEFFGDYWHGEDITSRTKIEEEKVRKEHFEKYGYNTLVIWEYELKDLKKVKEKIRRFSNG